MPANAQTVLAELRRLITSGDVNGDGRLPTERDLATRLGVGRRLLREALNVLEEEGLIWRRQGKGTFIGQPPDPHGQLAAEMVDLVDVSAIMEARLCIEPVLAGMAANRASQDDVERMRRLVDHIGLAPEADTAELWDGALHRLIARVAGNPIMLTAFQLLDEVRLRDDWLAMRANARSADSLADSDREHRAIVAAVAAGDARAAEMAMRQHLERLARNLPAAVRQEAAQ